MNKGSQSFMDRRLKERLIGATILVVIIILVVPELLSGPKRTQTPAAAAGGAGESVRSVNVDLDTRQATPAQDPASSAPPSASAAPSAATNSAPAALDSDAQGGESAAAGADADRMSGGQKIATLKAQQSSAAPLENASPAPNVRAKAKSVASRGSEGSSRGWSVQVGSFASRANAEKAVRHLKTLEPSAYLSSSGAGSSIRFRVRVGPFAERAGAEKAIARLKKDGESASLVAP